MKTCLFYNEEKDTLENTGVETQTEIINGEEFIKCIPKHLTSFTIGSYEKANVGSSNAGTIVLVIVLILIALALLVGGYIFYRKKFNNVDNSQLEQAFVNKNGLTSLIQN